MTLAEPDRHLGSRSVYRILLIFDFRYWTGLLLVELFVSCKKVHIVQIVSGLMVDRTCICPASGRLVAKSRPETTTEQQQVRQLNGMSPEN